MIDGQVDPLDYISARGDQTSFLTLWCVYGYDCFPTMIACKISHDMHGTATIWGYSVYKRSPGFRTLGQDLATFVKGKDLCVFFKHQPMALAYLGLLTTPKVKK